MWRCTARWLSWHNRRRSRDETRLAGLPGAAGGRAGRQCAAGLRGGSGLPACRAGGGRRHWRRADPPHVVWAGHCCVRLCAEPGPAGGRMGLHRAGVCHQHSGRVAGLSSVSGAVAAFARLFTARNRPLRGPCVRGLLCGGRRGGYTSGRRFHRRQRLAGHDPAPNHPAAGSGGQNGRRLRRDGHGVLDGWRAQPLVQRDGPGHRNFCDEPDHGGRRRPAAAAGDLRPLRGDPASPALRGTGRRDNAPRRHRPAADGGQCGVLRHP